MKISNLSSRVKISGFHSKRNICKSLKFRLGPGSSVGNRVLETRGPGDAPSPPPPSRSLLPARLAAFFRPIPHLGAWSQATEVYIINKCIAHFQKEWQTGARMGSRSIMGSFGGAFASAKTFLLTQVKVH